LTFIANCHTKTKDYEIALEYLTRVWNMADERFTLKSLPCAFACVEIANIYFLKEDLTNAIEYLRRGIDIFLEMNYDKFDYVSGLFLTLSQYYHQCDNTTEEIKCL